MTLKITEIEGFIEDLILTYGSADEFKKINDSRNADFFTHGFLDSFSVISVVALVEEKFSINFSPENLNSDQMRTVKGMSQIVLDSINHNLEQ